MAFTLTVLGIVSEDAGNYDHAATRFGEALVHARAVEDSIVTGLVLFHLGIIAWGQGNQERAEGLLNEALTCQRAAGDLVYGAAESLAFLGLFACEQGDFARSVELQRESLSLDLELGSKEVMAVNLANVAMLALSTQRTAAARLFGAAMGHREAIGNPFKLPERAVYDRGIDVTRAMLGEEDFESTWSAGRARSLAEAASDAFAVLDQIEILANAGGTSAHPAPAAPETFAGLTEREQEVLRLLINGSTNKEIAEELFISPRTAQGHVAHIFTKLNVSTRSAAVATALQTGFKPDRSSPR